MAWWFKRVVLIGLALILGALALGGVSLWLVLRGSLARESGRVREASLAGEVRVSRDDLGVVRIQATSGSIEDAAFAQGFVHAQERFFQMDGLRRRAAGEIAALIGPSGVGLDSAVKSYGWRAMAPRVLALLPQRHRALLERYCDGVNRGVADLGARPPEYVALMSEPRPWRPEDSVLCALAMHEGLSFGHRFEWRREALRATFDQATAEFLMPASTRWDTPAEGPAGDPAGPRAVPGADVLRAVRERAQAQSASERARTDERPPAPGSNNWAIGAGRTSDGRAILANDMHLGLMVPPTWFHVQIEWGGRRAVGVSLPGVPGVVAGSNGDVAWGFTNVTGDFEDWIVIEIDPNDPGRYMVPEGGSEPFGEQAERLEVRGEAARTFTYPSTRWGRVTRRDSSGRPMVLKWSALEAATANVGVLDMMLAGTLEEAIDASRTSWNAPQNVMIAARDGRIALVMSGWIPARKGFDGRYPVSWAKAGVGWEGALPEAKRPLVVNPRRGTLWSANSRAFAVERAGPIGGEWALGERSRRIAELLDVNGPLGERDMLDIQLDTRAQVLDIYRDAALDAIEAAGPDAGLSAVRDALLAWNGRADADQTGMIVLDRVRNALRERVMRPLSELVRARVPDYTYFSFATDEPMARLLEERPAHWLPSPYKSWDELILAGVREGWAAASDGARGVRTWGDVNVARVRHPLSRAVPWLGRWLDMPATSLAGHGLAVRVQGEAFGASERMVVSPGHEEQGVMQLPGGQSGHPMSRHYRSGWEAWARGEPSLLLAGEARSAFVLAPR